MNSFYSWTPSSWPWLLRWDELDKMEMLMEMLGGTNFMP